MMKSGKALIAAVVAAVAGPVPVARADQDWTSFPGGIASGATIAQQPAGGGAGVDACTLGFIAGDPQTHQLYGVTAGHCDDGGGYAVLYSTAAAQHTPKTLGTFTASRVDDGTAPTGPNRLPPLTDTGVIAIQSGTPIASFKLGGLYPVRSVVPAAPPLGTEVCKFGMHTGETCGPVVAASNTDVTAQLRAVHGDSGSALYRKNSDGTADLIGIASSGDTTAGTMKFFLAAPVLHAMGLQACGCGAI